ncbi:MAG: flagellar hook-length control protein FliK, partial [Planctomycetota bacterium]
GLRAHLAAGGGRLGSRFLAQLLSGRPHSNAGFAAALAQALSDPDAPGGREAWQRLGEALLGEEFNSASRSDAAQLGLIVAERDQLRDVWLRWGDGRGRRRRSGSTVRKLAVGVDFSATGRVRADFLWSAERLRVRLRAERPDVAERLRGDRAELEALLSQAGVDAALSIEHGAAHPPGQLDEDGPLLERTG